MLIFERLEGDIAVVENDGERIKLRKELISESVREGDVLKIQNGMYIPDKEATQHRRKKLTKLQNSLWGNK